MKFKNKKELPVLTYSKNGVMTMKEWRELKKRARELEQGKRVMKTSTYKKLHILQ